MKSLVGKTSISILWALLIFFTYSFPFSRVGASVENPKEDQQKCEQKAKQAEGKCKSGNKAACEESKKTGSKDAVTIDRGGKKTRTGQPQCVEPKGGCKTQRTNIIQKASGGTANCETCEDDAAAANEQAKKCVKGSEEKKGGEEKNDDKGKGDDKKGGEEKKGGEGDKGGQPPELPKPPEKQPEEKKEAQADPCAAQSGTTRQIDGSCKANTESSKTAQEKTFDILATVSDQVNGQLADRAVIMRKRAEELGVSLADLCAKYAYTCVTSASPVVANLIFSPLSMLANSMVASAADFSDYAVKKCASNQKKVNKQLDAEAAPHIALMPFEFVANQKTRKSCLFTDVLEKKFTRRCVQKCATQGGVLMVMPDSKLFGKGCINEKTYTIACRSELTDTVNGEFVSSRPPDDRYSDTSKKTEQQAQVRLVDEKQTVVAKVALVAKAPQSQTEKEKLGAEIRMRIDRANATLRNIMNTQYTLFASQLVDIKLAAETLGRETKASRVLFAQAADAFIDSVKSKYIGSDRAFRKNVVIMKQFPKTSQEYLKAQGEMSQLQKQLAAYGGIITGFGDVLPVDVSS
jgi:hypothetical protein